MNEKLRTIRLYGKLGSAYGRVHRLAVNSTAEAVRALSVLLPGFEKELMTSKDRGVGYACFIGKQNISEDQLLHPPGNDDIRIAPVLTGAKSGGLFQVVLGAALIVASFYTGGLATAGYLSAASAATLGSAAFSMGVAMALGGVSQMLTPTAGSLGTADSPDNGASYNFNGPVNVTAQGNPIPLLYGEMYCGSATVSAGIYSEDQQ